MGTPDSGSWHGAIMRGSKMCLRLEDIRSRRNFEVIERQNHIEKSDGERKKLINK
jgi:hypothetical protein